MALRKFYKVVLKGYIGLRTIDLIGDSRRIITPISGGGQHEKNVSSFHL